MNGRPLFRLAAIILFLSYADYGLQFLYQMVTGRILTVEDYGIYAAISSLATLFTLFSVSFPLLALRNISRVAADDARKVWPCLEDTFKRLSLLVLPFGLVVYGLSPWVKDFYHLDSVLPILVATTVYILGSYLNTFIAAMQALQLYTYSSALTFTFTVLRLLVGVFCVWFLQARYMGLFIGLLVASLLSLGFIYALLRHKVERGSEPIEPHRFSFEGWQSAILISVGMGTLIGLDTSIARHFFDPTAAGLYAAGSLTSKIIMMISAPFLNLVVPEVTRAKANAKSSYSVSRLMLMTVGISLVAWAGVSLMPGFILSVMVGQKFVEAAKIVPILAAATLCLANVSLMNQYCFALGLKRYFYFLYGAALLGIAGILIFFHETPMQLAWGIFYGALMAALSGAAVILWSRKKAALKVVA